MNKKLVTFLLLIVFAGIIFTGCAQRATKNEEKTLHRYVLSTVGPFDPAKMTFYTTSIYGDIGETLFQYKYTTDTYQLEPCIAKSMPVVSDNGLVYTIKLRKDAFFYDPLKKIFPKNKGRAVIAQDFVYSIKRLADPANKSGGWLFFDGRIKGLNKWVENGADYKKQIEGFKALDNNTIRLVLTKPYPQILNILAMPFTYPVPVELIKTYGKKWTDYPIGTGPFYLDHKETIPEKQYVLHKNPFWHGEKFPAASEAGPLVAKKLGTEVLKKYAGEKLPFVDKVIWYVLIDSNMQWQKFINGGLDFSDIPEMNINSVLVQGKLNNTLAQKGIKLDTTPALDITYDFFNMEDPFLGKNKKLRQAMSLAYNHEKALKILYNGRAESAQTMIPPGIGGYDPNFKNPYATYNPEKAKKLLAEAGYPGGKGLPVFKFQMYSTSPVHRKMVNFFIDNMKAIGIRIEAVPGNWTTFLQKINAHDVQIGSIAWSADYPDAQNFLQLNYGPYSAPGPNAANYNNPEFNALYKKSTAMQQSPERNKLYARAAQLAAKDCPWIMGVHRLSYTLEQPWLMTYLFRDAGTGYSKYMDIDVKMRNGKIKK